MGPKGVRVCGELTTRSEEHRHPRTYLEMVVVHGVFLISAKFPGIIHMCRILCTHQQACLDLQLKTQATYVFRSTHETLWLLQVEYLDLLILRDITKVQVSGIS